MIFGQQDLQECQNINIPSREEHAAKNDDPFGLKTLKTSKDYTPSQFIDANFPPGSAAALKYELLAEGGDVWNRKQNNWKPGNFLGLGPIQISNKPMQDLISRNLGYDITTEDGANRMLSSPIDSQKAFKIFVSQKQKEGKKFDDLPSVHEALAPGAERDLVQRLARLARQGISPSQFGIDLGPWWSGRLMAHDPDAYGMLTKLDAKVKAKKQQEEQKKKQQQQQPAQTQQTATKSSPAPLFRPLGK